MKIKWVLKTVQPNSFSKFIYKEDDSSRDSCSSMFGNIFYFFEVSRLF